MANCSWCAHPDHEARCPRRIMTGPKSSRPCPCSRRVYTERSELSGMWFVYCGIHTDTPHYTEAEAEEALTRHQERHRAEGLPC